jgi:hypothetical protein
MALPTDDTRYEAQLDGIINHLAADAILYPKDSPEYQCMCDAAEVLLPAIRKLQARRQAGTHDHLRVCMGS